MPDSAWPKPFRSLSVRCRTESASFSCDIRLRVAERRSPHRVKNTSDGAFAQVFRLSPSAREAHEYSGRDEQGQCHLHLKQEIAPLKRRRSKIHEDDRQEAN